VAAAYFSEERRSMNHLLIVDDTPEDVDMARAVVLASLADVDVQTASSGAEALKKIKQYPAILIVTGLHMPKMDGLELLRTVRRDHPLSPVVVMTAHGSEEIAAVALNEGASGYVPKRHVKKQLVPVVRRVLKSVAARHGRQRLEEILDFTETRFLLTNDPELAPPIIGYLQEKVSRLLPFDENELLRIGLAIDEALTNAIYHGNLEVSSELHELDDKVFEIVARQRRQQSPYNGRKIHIIARVSRDEFTCVIRDDGNGFTVDAIVDPLSHQNLGKAGGRGLFLIQKFMDEVRHNDVANEITMIKRRPN
jgi:CheY-like chemotaxis protein/anti-sigma regulatory factor (Ser/Thr protein kinase)